MPCPRTSVQRLKGHTGPVHVASYSKGAGIYCLTGGQDRTVRLWNPSKGIEVKKYEAHGYEVLSVDCSHDNARFVSSGGDKSVFYWDVTTGQTIRRIPGHLSRINTVSLNQDASVVVSGSFDSTVKIWDLKAISKSPIQSLEDSRDAIQALHVGSHEIITGSVDGHVRTYDLRKGQLTSDYLGQPITALHPNSASDALLVTTLHGKVYLLDRATGQSLNTFSGHAHESYRCGACFDGSPDTKDSKSASAGKRTGGGEETVLLGDEEGRVWAWDLVNATAIDPNPPPKVHDKAILWTEHHPYNNELLTASADGTIGVWGI